MTNADAVLTAAAPRPDSYTNLVDATDSSRPSAGSVLVR